MATVLLGACSATDPRFLATQADDEGQEPTEVEVSFAGNRNLGLRALLDAIRPTMLTLSRGQAPEASAYDGADFIKELYRGEGFPDVDVEWSVEGPTQRSELPDLVNIPYTIAEGPRVTVSEMTIEGTTIGTDLLLPLWERRQSGALGLGPPLFHMRSIFAFEDAITTYYRQRGYLEVRVTPEVVRDKGEDTAAVSMRVTEGRQFRFGSVSLDLRLLNALGSEIPQLPDGEVFTTGRTQELLLEVQGILRRRGYPDPIVRIPPFPGLTEPVIDLQLVGDPGRLASVAEVRITGAEATQEGFIRQRLSLQVGDRYDGRAVDDAIANLYRTGVFRRVLIRHQWIDDDTVRLDIDIEEADTKSVEFMAGYGSWERLRAGVSFGERNLFGTGRRFLIDGTVSQRGYRVVANLTDPDLFGTDIIGSVELETFEREMPSFTDNASGGTASISRQLSEGVVGRFGYTYLPRNGATSNVVTPAGFDADFIQGSLFLSFRYDDRDSVLAPTTGKTAFIAGDWFDPALGADVSFTRLRAGGTHHFPLPGDLRLAVRAEAGWIWPGEEPIDVPIQERFFNGGENTVRSFRQDQLGPTDAFGNPVGGEFRNIFSVEMRIPVYRTLETALFADAGNVGLLVQDYTLRDLSYGLGAGLRVALPIGPLRFDWAWNPDPGPFDRDWTAHFSIGYPF